MWVRTFNAFSAEAPEVLHLFGNSIVHTHQRAAGGKGVGPRHRPLPRRVDATDPCNRRRQRPAGQFALSAGQVSNKTVVATPLAGGPPVRDTVADRGHDARAILDPIRGHGLVAAHSHPKQLKGAEVG